MTNLRYLQPILAILAAFVPLSIPAPTPSAAAPPAPLVTTIDGAVRLDWQAPSDPGSLRAADQPLVEIDGLRLPARLVALRVAGDAPIVPQFELLESAPWQGQLAVAERPVRQTIDGALRTTPAAATNQSAPRSPIVVLREGRMRGVRVAVLALTQVFAGDGGLRAVTAVRATIAGAAPLDADAATLLASAGRFLAAAPGPSNPAATGTSWTVRVTQAGIQRLPAATLSAAGVDLANPALLHLYHRGVEVALERRGSGASLELRFFAPEPGDIWNATDIYWLTIESIAGATISTRSAQPGAAGPGVARELGIWRNNTLYDSAVPGPDGDHWFAADLKTGPGLAPATLSAPLTPTLPLAAGNTQLTVYGSAYTSGQHILQVTLGAEIHSATWSGAGNWSQSFSFSTASPNVLATLVPGSAPDGVEIDSIAWDRPVVLNAGGRGAFFDGAAGTYKYQISNAAADRSLYDVTNPRAPQLLDIPPGATTSFEDGASRQYLLTGPGTLFAPTVTKHQPFDLATPAQAIYISPAAFQVALAPLIARRQAQGYAVRVIDPQALYDAWSFGQVDPRAIRDFLRYAGSTWNVALAAVTLVGDGTADPLNYLKRDDPNFIPPYLADVDPWIGETACENCFVRLDGSNPTLDPLPDLQLGRLTVNSPSELSAVVAKIIGYETAPRSTGWGARSVYIADNYRQADNTTDQAGDFAALADASAAQQPDGIEILRLYYDPTAPASGGQAREPDAVRAHQRTLGLLNQGAGLVNYVGHSSQYQWASTDPQKSPPYLLGLYDPDDLANGSRLPIVLAMTCLTSAFQTPNFSRTTLDERWLLKPDGGAVAIWGPTGFGVAHGHDTMQRGFYRALWAAPPQSAKLGQLTAAGYLELFTTGSCCQDTLATFALLGDPLTTARVQPAQRVFLPVGRR
ncbi:MAG TPA: C25 family cysteine peptidase [Roseiflexaceae bacterium]|nr:C25 family cysteine peptidase [Roseiflexaceae bacterium]